MNTNTEKTENGIEIDILTGEVLDKNNIDSVINFVDSAEKVMHVFDVLEVSDSSEDTGNRETGENVDDNKENPPKQLFFMPRKWKFNLECDKNRGERTIITDMFGKLSEAFCIGDWWKNWTEIQSEQLPLEKNTDYVFTFWLNGGENDRFQETCRLEIIFDNDFANSYVYKLNRDIIKPVKRYNGWVLFEIPFRTELNDYTRLKFAVMDAYTAILPALGKEAYKDLPDDKIDPRVPQRHNIIFKDGFPRDSSWSYLFFGEKYENGRYNKADNGNNNQSHGFSKNFENFGDGFQRMGDIINDKVNAAMGFAGGVAEKVQEFKKSVYDEAYEDIMDEIEDELINEIKNELKDDMKESMKSQIMNEILSQFNKRK